MPNNGKQDKLPVVAICYDFDKTLSPDDMGDFRKRMIWMATLHICIRW